MYLKQRFFILIFYFISFPVWAQDFHFGVKVGVDVVKPSVHVDNNELIDLFSPEPIWGFNVNGIIEYRFWKEIGVTIEPGYIQKGFKYKNSSLVKINYWQLPLLVDYHVSEEFVLFLGPELTYSKGNLDLGLIGKPELSGVFGVNFSLTEYLAVGLKASSSIKPSLSVNLTDMDSNEIGRYREHNQYLQWSLAYKI